MTLPHVGVRRWRWCCCRRLAYWRVDIGSCTPVRRPFRACDPTVLQHTSEDSERVPLVPPTQRHLPNTRRCSRPLLLVDRASSSHTSRPYSTAQVALPRLRLARHYCSARRSCAKRLPLSCRYGTQRARSAPLTGHTCGGGLEVHCCGQGTSEGGCDRGNGQSTRSRCDRRPGEWHTVAT